MTSSDKPTYTILEADGQHPDQLLEDQIFNDDPTHPYNIRFVRGTLAPSGTADRRPWTDIPKKIRDEVDGLMILKLRFGEKDLELFPRLKVVVRMGVGYDVIDRPACARRGVTVCNVPDYGTEDIADHAIGLALSLRRGILLHNDLQRARPPAPYCPITHPLIARSRGATFGILGLGRIGTAVALRAKAFGWHVIFYDPYLPNGADKAVGVERMKSIKDLFRRSSILSIHCPATRETKNMVNYDLLSLLPSKAVLVNTARGEVVDLDAVERCLKEGGLVGAGLDVLPIEPPSEPVHSLVQAYRDREPWLIGRMVLTCHTAFFSPSSLEEIRSKSAQTMREVVSTTSEDFAFKQTADHRELQLIDKLQSNVITPEME